MLGGSTPPLPCLSAWAATSRQASLAPQYSLSTAGSQSPTVSNFSLASRRTALVHARFPDVRARRAEVSDAGDVRESRWRLRRERTSHVRQADLVVEFIVDRAAERADIRDRGSEEEAGPRPRPANDAPAAEEGGRVGRADREVMMYLLT